MVACGWLHTAGCGCLAVHATAGVSSTSAFRDVCKSPGPRGEAVRQLSSASLSMAVACCAVWFRFHFHCPCGCCRICGTLPVCAVMCLPCCSVITLRVVPVGTGFWEVQRGHPMGFILVRASMLRYWCDSFSDLQQPCFPRCVACPSPVLFLFLSNLGLQPPWWWSGVFRAGLVDCPALSAVSILHTGCQYGNCHWQQ